MRYIAGRGSHVVLGHRSWTSSCESKKLAACDLWSKKAANRKAHAGGKPAGKAQGVLFLPRCQANTHAATVPRNPLHPQLLAGKKSAAPPWGSCTQPSVASATARSSPHQAWNPQYHRRLYHRRGKLDVSQTICSNSQHGSGDRREAARRHRPPSKCCTQPERNHQSYRDTHAHTATQTETLRPN